jgi:hypothetical protein
LPLEERETVDAGILPHITATRGSSRSGPKASTGRRSGRDAVGASTAAAWSPRLHDASITEGLPRIHHVPPPGAARSARRTSTASPGVSTPGDAERCRPARPQRPDGSCRSQTERTAGPGRIRFPADIAPRPTLAGRTPVAASAPPVAAGATHRVSKLATTAPAARPFGSPNPRRNGRPTPPAPSVLPGSRAASASGAPSLASSGVENLAAAGGRK